MSCPPNASPENQEPVGSACDYSELYINAYDDAVAEQFSDLPNFLASLLAGVAGGALGSFLAKGAGASARGTAALEELLGALSGGAVGSRLENGQEGAGADEVAGVVAGFIGGALVASFGSGALLALAASTVAAIAIQAAVRAKQIADEQYANCSPDEPKEQADRLPGDDGPADCPPVSPLIFDLDGDGVETLSLDAAGVFFDLDGDGRAERTGWVAPHDALLALDRNADGLINDISELFGSVSEDGFSVLRREDENGDGRIDAQDAVFEDLRLWKDANSDGIAQEDELLTLAKAGITEIDLNARFEDFRVDAGIVTHSSTATKADGTAAEILDVWFDNNTSWTDGDQSAEVSDVALRLPGLKGSGQVADLWVAMDGDPALMEAVRDLLVSMHSMSASEYRAAIEGLAAKWAGVEDVAPDGRGEWMDGQHLAVLEVFLGITFRQASGVNAGTGDPGPNAAYVIEAQYDDLISRFMTEFAAQSSLSSLLLLRDLTLAGDTRAAPLSDAVADTSALILGSLSYNFDTTRVALASAENAIALMLRGMPDDNRVEYLDRYLGRLAGLEREHFGRDRAGWEGWLIEQLALIDDQALREIALKLALGQRLFTGTAGDDSIATDDTAPDFLVRQPVAEQAVIQGGAGNDALDGKAGGDTYVFSVGDGSDTIIDSFFDGVGGFGGGAVVDTFGNPAPGLQNVYVTSLDTVIFPGRNIADAVFGFDGDDLLVTFNDATGDTLRIVGHFALTEGSGDSYFTYAPGRYGAVERFVFADGVLDRIPTNPATEGDNILLGTLGDDLIASGGGNDRINGGGGNDVFVYGDGDGQDVIDDAPVSSGGDWVAGTFVGDKIKLTDATLSDLSLTRTGSDVTLTFAGGDGSITIRGQGQSTLQGSYAARAIEGIEFADGTCLRLDVVDLAVNGAPGAGLNPYLYGVANADASGVVRDSGPQTANGVFVGGASAVTFAGGAGHDTYILSQADQPVVIDDRVPVFNLSSSNLSRNGQDVLILSDMALSDVNFERRGDDLILRHLGAEVARLVGQFGSFNLTGDGIEAIIDGTGRILTTQAFADLTTTLGGDGDDALTGIQYSTADFSPVYTNDVFVGGRGDDDLRDTNGSEVYRYAQGDGRDTIRDSFSYFAYDPGSDEDQLVLTDLTLADVRISRMLLSEPMVDVSPEILDTLGIGNWGALRIEVLADGGRIDISDQFISDLGGIEFIEFADGTVLGKDGISQQALVRGTAGDDLAGGYFSEPDVTFDLGLGNDTLQAFGEGTRAIYAMGDGNDMIGAVAILQLMDVNADGVRLTLGTDDAIRLDIRATGETLTFRADAGFASQRPGDGADIGLFSVAFDDPNTVETALLAVGLQEIRFASGQVWDFAELLSQVELPTTEGDDSVDGGAGNDRAFGGAGDDTLSGGTGDDVLSGGAGLDVLSGGDGNDRLILSADGDALLDGGAGRDLVDGDDLTLPLVIDLAADLANGTPINGVEDATGGRGDDLITGDDGGNLLLGGIGRDTLSGGDGDDRLDGGRGADVLAGGDGIDTADYAGSRAGVRVALDGTAGVGGHAQGDMLSGIEELTGSNYADVLTGDGGANVLRGLAGRDTLDGQGGDDRLFGGEGADTLHGGEGDDLLFGGEGGDRLKGGLGHDTLQGGGSDDTIDGGSGNDVYLWALGDGRDVIRDGGPLGDTDVLVLEGLLLSDVTLLRVGDQLSIVTGIGQSLVVPDQFTGGGIEEIRFADGGVLTRDAFEGTALLQPNQAPLGQADQGLQVTVGTTVIAAADLLRNDFDYEGQALSITRIASAFGGTAVLTTTGDVSFTAATGATTGGFTYILSDGSLTGQANATLVFSSNTAPTVAASLADQTGGEDTPVSFTLPEGAFADADGDPLTLTARLVDGSALPAWLSFDGTTFTGTPPANFNGAVEITVTASDGSAEVSDTFTLTLAARNDAPIAGDDIFNAGRDRSFVIPASRLLINDRDVDGDTLRVISATGALGVTVTVDGSGNLLVTRDPLLSDRVAVDYVVSDGSLTDAGQVFIDLLPSNVAPVIAPIAAILSDEDQAISVMLPANTVTDANGDPLSISLSRAGGTTLPSWLSFDAQTLRISGTPPSNFNGTIGLQLTASDGLASATRAFDLVVRPVNDAPILSAPFSDRFSAEDQPLSIQLQRGLFTDPDGDPLTVDVRSADGSALPSWLRYDATSFALTGQPPVNVNGIVPLRVFATDGRATISDDFNLTITPVNDAPVLLQPLADVTRDSAGAVLATGRAFSITAQTARFADPDADTLAFASTLSNGAALPSWLSFNGTTYSGTAPRTAAGTIELMLKATDGRAEVSDIFTLTFEARNTAPTPANDAFSVAVPNTVRIPFAALLANDRDPDGDALSVAAVGTAANGTVAVADGEVRYTPFMNFEGTDQFTYTVSDGLLRSTATVSIAVTNDFDVVQQGGSGTDVMLGTFGNDLLFGGAGVDIFVDLGGNDWMDGGDGADILIDGLGSDTLIGGAGNDVIYSLLGNNQLRGGRGDDILFGGLDKDQFWFGRGDGRDTVYNFVGTRSLLGSFIPGDEIRLSIDGVQSFAQLMQHASETNGGVLFNFANGDELFLSGTRLAALDDNQFSFY